jgi:hypothetical protein
MIRNHSPPKDESIDTTFQEIKKEIEYYTVKNSNSEGPLDDEDGYLIVKPGDHILHRFEVITILGKGSFAQVVSAVDHKFKTRVAIKINRNTEIDH